jgi:hypothetical protein
VGGIPQLLKLPAVALAIFAVLLLAAFLVGRLFPNKRARKRIISGAIALYLLAFVSYLGFIALTLSGNLKYRARLFMTGLLNRQIYLHGVGDVRHDSGDGNGVGAGGGLVLCSST